ncbi:hypothetical protein ACFXPM_13905, partial [Streptomyces sp. NPDC059095]|uniref:hypothetical protein n=1 Tax=Streptomyces sp. NPDC059095 TaxID=3346726 RepID=UPI0036983AAD
AHPCSPTLPGLEVSRQAAAERRPAVGEVARGGGGAPAGGAARGRAPVRAGPAPVGLLSRAVRMPCP